MEGGVKRFLVRKSFFFFFPFFLCALKKKKKKQRPPLPLKPTPNPKTYDFPVQSGVGSRRESLGSIGGHGNGLDLGVMRLLDLLPQVWGGGERRRRGEERGGKGRGGKDRGGGGGVE